MSTPISPLDALIAAYLQAIESGQVPDRRELLDRNPDHAEALQTFFADFDRMDRVASPLRIAGEHDETAALNTSGPTQLPTVRYFGDYELLEEVARGGMGIVYKARQTSLNRLVALKMILAGTFATSRDVARFQAEAEAAANLDHPHIVPVYEVGEHEGQQYFSMKFVEGGSLANHPRGDVKPEVRGLITIARAVHHAHQHGVLHRDLKPSNVLVDAKGDRHVTDFGLAKRLADLDRSLTDPGQILGTPRYMSPEQALGRKDLTVAADIYALGVILYERLTGQTPFDGQTPLALLRQAREIPPPRPTTIRPGLDRDLETIVLKCLEKDPNRRYPTAEDLAQDLTRWLEGRPITARPVTQAEKFARWCRRNPAIATLAASVALALLLGTVVSSLFAYQERKSRIRAEGAESVALSARDETERTFARSLARPLDPDGVNKRILSEPEVEALWELSSQGTESLKNRFLDEATHDPFATRQLYARSEPALIAALGLDPARRARAARLLVGCLGRSGLSAEAKFAFSFLLLEIDDGLDPWAEEAVRIILRTLDDNLTRQERDALVTKIATSSRSISPSKASALLVAVLEREPVVKVNLSVLLGELSGRLDPAEAAAKCGRAARSVVEALGRENDMGNRGDMARDLAALSCRLDPTSAEVIARQLVEVIGRTTGATARSFMFEALASLSGQLGPHDEAIIARFIADAFGRETNADVRFKMSECLRTFSGRIDPVEASVLCGRAVRLIADSLARETDDQVRDFLAQALAELCRGLDPIEAATIGRFIADLMGREKNASTRYSLSQALGMLSDRIDPDEAATLCGQAARSIEKFIGREPRFINGGFPPNSWEPLSGWLDPAVATKIARPIVDSIGHETDAFARFKMAECLGTLSGRLDPAEASVLCGRAVRLIADSLAREADGRAREILARALEKLSRGLDPIEAATIARSIEREIARSIERKEDEWVRYRLAECLGVLSVRLDPAEASAIARTTVEAIGRETDVHARSSLAYALASLSGRLDVAEAAALCGRAARSTAEAISRHTDKNVDVFSAENNRFVLAQALASLSTRLDLTDASMMAQTVTNAFSHEEDRNKIYYLGDIMASLSMRLDSVTIIRDMCLHICSYKNHTNASSLRDLLTSPTPSRQNERYVRFAATVLQNGPGGTLAATIREATESYPCRLKTQELVELLKMPTCFGEARRVVLDQLEHIHGRRFANHWEFVRFAQEKGLKLDLTSPPRRPDPKASPGRLLDELPRNP